MTYTTYIKVAISFPINIFHKHKTCVEFCRKKTHFCLPTFKLTSSTNNYLKTYPLNIIFDDFRIWLLGYSEFSCLYFPKGHTCISSLWLACSDDYKNIMILSKSPTLKFNHRNHLCTVRRSEKCLFCPLSSVCAVSEDLLMLFSRLRRIFKLYSV